MMQKSGTLKEIMKSYTEEFSVSYVCTTQRKVISPKKHDFTSVIYDAKADEFVTEKAYKDIDVIDRIGSGDAYVSGALYGLIKNESAKSALIYGNATSSVKNTIPGDLPASDLTEIEGIIESHSGEGDESELSR